MSLIAIAGDVRQIRLDLQGNVMSYVMWMEGGRDLMEHASHIDRLAPDRHFARLQAVEIKQVIDHPVEPPGVVWMTAANSSVRCARSRLLLKHLAVAQDDGQWGAEIMGENRQKIALPLAEPLQFCVRRPLHLEGTFRLLLSPLAGGDILHLRQGRIVHCRPPHG